jgi:DNA-binding Lrp family transcriptional regulator
MTYQEIADCIVPDSISITTETSQGRTNKKVSGGNTEFNVLAELLAQFDVVFKAKHPKSKGKETLFFIHINIEAQKDFRPGYPVEKRGLFNIARLLSSQLPVLKKGSKAYGKLEKVYSIFICHDRIPKAMQNSVSLYEMSNTWNSRPCLRVKKEDYDLMALVVVRLGNSDEDSEEHIVRFLNALLHTRSEESYKVIGEYVDFSDSLKTEVKKVMSIGELNVKYGAERREKEIVMSMYEREFSVEQIAEILKITVAKVKRIIKEKEKEKVLA